MNILIVGGAGKTAKPIIDVLNRENHNITVFDICSGNERYKYICGDIADIEALSRAMKNIDAVIHLAVNISDTANDEFTFKTNVFGAYNVLHSAVENKISKILIASSAPVHVTDEININSDYICSAGEDFAYDLTKSLQEVMARHFSRTYSLNCLIMRLGHIVDGENQISLSGEPLSDLSYCRGGWVCKYDVAEAFAKAVKTDFKGYSLINIIGSYQAEGKFNLSAAKELIGFECRQKFFGYEIK